MVEKTPDIPAAQLDPIESRGWIIALFVLMLVFLLAGVLFNTVAPKQEDFRLWTGLLGLLTTIAIYSMLYKENPIFRLFEHIFVGLSVGTASSLPGSRFSCRSGITR